MGDIRWTGGQPKVGFHAGSVAFSYAETPSSKPLKAESHLNLSLQIKKMPNIYDVILLAVHTYIPSMVLLHDINPAFAPADGR